MKRDAAGIRRSIRLDQHYRLEPMSNGQRTDEQRSENRRATVREPTRNGQRTDEKRSELSWTWQPEITLRSHSKKTNPAVPAPRAFWPLYAHIASPNFSLLASAVAAFLLGTVFAFGAAFSFGGGFALGGALFGGGTFSLPCSASCSAPFFCGMSQISLANGRDRSLPRDIA